jgi:hypothetical protein
MGRDGTRQEEASLSSLPLGAKARGDAHVCQPIPHFLGRLTNNIDRQFKNLDSTPDKAGRRMLAF